MYLNTDADRVDPAKVLMASDAAQLSPEGISYSNSHWMPVTSGQIDFLELFSGSARLSQVAALSGLRVGTPVGFRTGSSSWQSSVPHGRLCGMLVILNTGERSSRRLCPWLSFVRQ